MALELIVTITIDRALAARAALADELRAALLVLVRQRTRIPKVTVLAGELAPRGDAAVQVLEVVRKSPPTLPLGALAHGDGPRGILRRPRWHRIRVQESRGRGSLDR